MLRRSLRLFGLALMGLFALGLLAGPASAGEVEEYPEDPGIEVDDSTPDAGDTITVSGQACAAGVGVDIFLGGVKVGETVTDSEGKFSVDIEVPENTAPGTYELTAVGCDVEVLGVTITVGGPTPGGTALPVTGSSSTEPLVRTGAVLVAAGAVLVYAVRRRQQATLGS